MNNSIRLGLGLLLAVALVIGSSGCGAYGGAVLAKKVIDSKACDSCKPAATCADCPDAVIVNVANDNGSYTPVNLKRQGSEYVGPRGEYYHDIPTQDQLRPYYGI